MDAVAGGGSQTIPSDLSVSFSTFQLYLLSVPLRSLSLTPPYQQVLDPDYRRPSHARRARVHHGVRGSEGANGGIRGGRVAARDDEEDLEEEQGPHAFASARPLLSVPG